MLANEPGLWSFHHAATRNIHFSPDMHRKAWKVPVGQDPEMPHSRDGIGCFGQAVPCNLPPPEDKNHFQAPQQAGYLIAAASLQEMSQA